MTEAWHFWDGAWVSGNPPIIGPMTHAGWMASVVFDGARVFEGVAPDLDLHCARANRSALAMGLEPRMDPEEMVALACDGAGRFDADAALYVRPMYFAETGFVAPDPESTRFVLSLFVRPMPAEGAQSLCHSPIRRPAPDQAPTDAKAACLYPNAGRGLADARRRGFDNGVVRDPIGNVAETLSSNLFIVRDGVVATPSANGCFLAGVTRGRVISLLRGAGVMVEERAVKPSELDLADEMFTTGNYGKVQAVTRFEDRALQPGPIYRRARALYWEYAHDVGRRHGAS